MPASRREPLSLVAGGAGITTEECLLATIDWLKENGLTANADGLKATAATLASYLEGPLSAIVGLPIHRPERLRKREFDALCEQWRERHQGEQPKTVTDQQWALLNSRGQRNIFLDLSRLPNDAIAFYRPFHMEPHDHWGIYIFVDQLLEYAGNVRPGIPFYGSISNSVFMHLVLFEIFHHEFFHHIVESTATTLEILAGALDAPVPSYLRFWQRAYNCEFGWHPHQPLEEALANAYAYNSLGFISRVKTGYRDYLVDLYQKAIRTYWRSEAAGYREAEHYVAGGQIGGATDLLAMLIGLEPKNVGVPLYQIAKSVMPSGFAAYMAKPDIPTRFVGTKAQIDALFELVPAPNETCCNLFWPIDTKAADALLKAKKAEEKKRIAAAQEAKRRTNGGR